MTSRSFERGTRVLFLLCGFLLFASTASAQASGQCGAGQPFGTNLLGSFPANTGVTVYSNCSISYDPVIISAATNTNPVIFTAANHGLGANGIQQITIYGASGN